MSKQADTSDEPNVIAPPPLIFAAGFAAGLVLNWLLPVHAFAALPIKIAGRILAVAAGLLALWAAWTMRRAGTHIDPRQPTTAIVTNGPFRFTRNPLYLSLTLLSVGLSLLGDIPWVLAALIPTLLIVHLGVSGQ
ncbi:MAG: methyltransferase [Verrucomicrobiota bacterium]|jgi:protein-S-isoprenylcysteine O-methyltransferase Ste14